VVKAFYKGHPVLWVDFYRETTDSVFCCVDMDDCMLRGLFPMDEIKLEDVR